MKEDDSVSHYSHFTGVGCEHILKKLGIYEVKVLNIGKSREYEAVSRQMVYEFIMERPMHKALCSAYILELLSIIGRRYALKENRVTLKSEDRINNICAFIYDNIASLPSVESLAKKCYLSVSRFLHLFKEVTGRSYNEFVTYIRISNARELLINTEMSVCDIASAIGYEDQNYFSRVFKKIVGCSPTEYRREMK
jgi:AraC-like DNA-binding protein